MLRLVKVLCILVIILPIESISLVENGNFNQFKYPQRSKRAIPLIFPPTAPTRTQWIAGIGIPLEDLLFEALTTGYVFKAEYRLPSKAEDLRTKTQTNIERRRRSSFNSNSTLFERHLVDEEELRDGNLDDLLKNTKKVYSSYRWSIYRGLEGLADRLGLQGRSCVLKSICEVAEVPFHYKNGMLGELLHILLTPSSSADEISEHSDNEYFSAEHFGRSHAGCDRIFRDCPKSLLDHFSNIHQLTKDLTMLMG